MQNKNVMMSIRNQAIEKKPDILIPNEEKLESIDGSLSRSPVREKSPPVVADEK